MLNICCSHCDSAASDSPLVCACGVPVTCDYCDGAGCRCCGRWGWFSVLETESGVECADEIDGGFDWDAMRADRYEDAMFERFENATSNNGEGR